MSRTWCCDPFPSIDKIRHVRFPTLIMHGLKVMAGFLCARCRCPGLGMVAPNAPACPCVRIWPQDEVVAVSHGYRLHDACNAAVPPLFLPNAGHNDLELHPEYLSRLRLFFREIAAHRQANGTPA